jgi:Uma2 family endonuclease
MSAIAAELTYTPEDLLLMGDAGKGFELVNGQLVEKNMGGFASCVAVQISRLLLVHGQDMGLGWVLDSEGSYQCFPNDRRKVRKPDVSFIRRDRLPEERIPDGHISLAPDLAVEVVSPNDTAYEVETKVEEYLQAGFPLVWVVNPRVRTIHVYRADGTVERLLEDAVLTAPELFPSLRCRVADLFTLAPRG